MKSKNGITMVILVITIIVMSIITGTVVTQSIKGLETNKINDLYNDIRLIKDKVSIYYTKYNTLPVGDEYTGNDDFKTVKNPNDGNKYYEINLNMLENLTLSKENKDSIFIINEDTHTIYFPEGLEVDGVWYYTLPDKFTPIK